MTGFGQVGRDLNRKKDGTRLGQRPDLKEDPVQITKLQDLQPLPISE